MSSNSKGFTIVEILIALGLLGGIVAAVAIFGSVSTSELTHEGHTICESVASASMNNLRSYGYEDARAAVNNNTIDTSNVDNEAVNRRHLFPESTLHALNQTSAGRYYLETHRTIVGSMTLLGAIYNSNINYCRNPIGMRYTGGSRPLLLEPADDAPETSYFSNFRTHLRIQFYNLNDGNLSCPDVPEHIRPISARVGNSQLQPVSETMGMLISPPNTRHNVGYEVTVTTTYFDNKRNSDGQCSVKARFQYPRLNSNLNMAGSSVSRRPGTITVGACGSTSPSTTMVFQRHSDYSAQGYTYMCRDLSASGVGGAPPCANNPGNQPVNVANNGWRPCHEVTLCGRAPSSTTNVGRNIENTYTGLPYGCNARVDMRVVNLAGDTPDSEITESFSVPVPPCQTCSTACTPFSFCPPTACTTCTTPSDGGDGGEGQGSDGGDNGGGGSRADGRDH